MGIRNPEVIQTTKHESACFLLHGGDPPRLLMMFGIFAFLRFSAAPKLAIKGQESTNVGRERTEERLVHARSDVARPVWLSLLSVCSPTKLPGRASLTEYFSAAQSSQ